ncbi:hypothetical protein [Pseudoalteromonas luteoviolacea]|uniref:Uncharacterized protein n=1 Tax=Pseudoalteromonas luteoviolacea DSM 6061 TaxID=1365250 RepID=A0A166VAX1_9GAMM|nr:hypothetical protein [Pseudoalteromonas luteoviolacea]KZN32434.1 hypothetical protein N475_22395 [Pseudoalteromonas luteoviolacea DSM 6061]KZN56668.1 hypothetical protein N474_10980 [Pseudoalteromonas luteoviolacea CPMOR-2]MBE0386053.1 hypothetical protein [Pseudoalteromonas luteoviolacea DSM 6061]TQF70968.1 hypothetical protein FLM44_07735 [Pseudoalteromonas luteoviolacea]
MAQKTLSGILAAIDAEQIAVNMTATKSLYRYTGIVDRVNAVKTDSNVNLSTANDDNYLTNTLGLADGNKILLTKQSTTSQNGVYQRVGNTLNLIAYPNIELGNLVELLGTPPTSSTEFYKLMEGNLWASVTFNDGVIAV